MEYTRQMLNMDELHFVSNKKKAQFKFTLRQLLPAELTLSQLEPFSLTPGWRQPELDRTFTGKGLSIKGQHYENGIGMPTNSEIAFEVNGIYDKFSALVGLDDEFNSNDGNVEFVLLGDGNELWHSKQLKKADGAVSVNVAVKGVKKITLSVRRPEGENGRAPADWVNAKLVGIGHE